MTVAEWIAGKIHPSVTVSTLRELMLVPAPPVADVPDGYSDQLKRAREAALASRNILTLPREAYIGKDINEIIVPAQPFQAGNVVFYMVNLPGSFRSAMAECTRAQEGTEDEVPLCRRLSWFAFPISERY
jgi:hypothetical protein